MNRVDLIFKLYPQVITVRGNVAYDEQDNVVEYDPTLIDAEIAKTEYRRHRAAEYPTIGDQLDALFHAGVFPAEMAAQIQAIKDRYPKPE
jgi:hypothetical protein